MERYILLRCWVLSSFETFITRKTKPKYSTKVSTTVSKLFQKSKTVRPVCHYLTLLGHVLLNLFLLSVFFSALFNLKHPERKILYQLFFFPGSQSPFFLASFTSCSTLQHLARQCSTLKSFCRF